MTEPSPYTRVMHECLSSLDSDLPDEIDAHCPVGHLLTNMLQGRMLEHLKHRVSEHYGFHPEDLSDEFSTALIEVFNHEIFEAFRKKIESQPWLIPYLARRIVDVELSATPHPEHRINRLYLSIFCRYLEYRNLDQIIETLQQDPRIQQTILKAQQRSASARSLL
ncbi:MAG: hypothetical protein ACO4AU_06375 [bacterium]|jgi:hypothetical protein